MASACQNDPMKKSVPILVGVIVMLMLMMAAFYLRLTWRDFRMVCLMDPPEEVARRIRFGADVNHIDEYGYTPLLYALSANDDYVWDRFPEFIGSAKPTRMRVCDAEVVRLLLDAGADIHHVWDDVNAFSLAASCGDLHAVRLLLERGADINFKGPNGETALMLAVQNNDATLVDFLIRSGADLNVTNNDGDTALYLACVGDQIHMVEMLASGSSIEELTNTSGESIVDLAVDSSDPVRMLHALIDGATAPLPKPDDSHILDALDDHDHELAKLLIQLGANVNAHYPDRYPLIYLMIDDAPAADLVALLVQSGADVNVSNSDGNTPLTMSILFKRKLCSALLIAAGADLNLDGKKPGITPLAIASQVANVELVRYLLDKGADPNVVGNDGFTPLHLALMGTPDDKPSIEVVKLLLDHGANPRIKTKAIGTPIESAEGEFLKLMESHPASHP